MHLWGDIYHSPNPLSPGTRLRVSVEGVTLGRLLLKQCIIFRKHVSIGTPSTAPRERGPGGEG